MSVRAVLAAAMVFTSTSAVSADLPKQPTGKWIVHYDDAQCVAERNYGTEEDPLYLVLKQPPLGDTMVLSIMEKGSAREAEEVSGKLQFDDRPPLDVSVLRFASRETKLRALVMNLPSERFSPARTASTLRLRTKGLDETLALVRIGPLLEVMDACVADLRKIWNVMGSGERERAVREDAKGELRGLFRPEDYPDQALFSGKSGRVRLALLIDEQGKVADCSVMETSGVAVLDTQSCSVLKERARFTPAVGLDGKPAKQAFIQAINWRLQ